MTATISPDEVLALLLLEPDGRANQKQLATAFVRDPQGGLMLRSVVPSRKLLESALVTARCNSGTPIIDPHTREVIGYELAPLAVA